MGIERKAYLPPEVGPKIRYKKEVISPDYPYRFGIEKDRLDQLMRVAGVSDEKINTIEVVVEKDRRGNFRAAYSPLLNEIVISADRVVKDIDKKMKKAEKIADSRKKPMLNKFRGMYSGKRLGRYLTVAPKERGLKIAEKLISRAEERQVENMMAHEVRHASDPSYVAFVDLGFRFGGGAIGLWDGFFNHKDLHNPALNLADGLFLGAVEAFIGYTWGYLASPGEVKARLFTWRRKKEIPHFVSITAKESK